MNTPSTGPRRSREDFDFRKETRADGVGDNTGKPLIGRQTVRDATNMLRAILHADEQGAACSIRLGAFASRRAAMRPACGRR